MAKQPFNSAAPQTVCLYYSAQAAERMDKVSTSDNDPVLSAYVRDGNGNIRTVWFTVQYPSEEAAQDYRWTDKVLNWKGAASDMVLIDQSVGGLVAEEAFKHQDEKAEEKARALMDRVFKATTLVQETTLTAPKINIRHGGNATHKL